MSRASTPGSANEPLNRETFYSLREAQIIIEGWRKHDNTKRPHSALGYRPPAPETVVQMDPRPAMHEQSDPTSQIRLFSSKNRQALRKVAIVTH